MTGLLKYWNGTSWQPQKISFADPQYAVNTIAASGATETLPATHQAHDVTMDQDCTFTFSNPSSNGHTFLLRLRGMYTPTFPSNVTWDDGVAAYVSTNFEYQAVYAFSTNDAGTSWTGSVVFDDLGFSPSMLSPAAWYDAADATSFTYSSGSVVSQWGDKSGNGRDMAQGTVASQPSRTGTLNGRPTVVFDATDDLLSAFGTWVFMHDGTTYIFGIVWRTVSANPDKLSSIINTSEINSSWTGMHLFHDDRSSVPINDAVGYYVLNGSGSTVPVNGVGSAGDAWPAGSFGSLTALVDPDNATASDRAKLYKSNTLVSAAETSTATVSTGNPSRGLRMAGPGGLGTYTSIEIAELVIVSGANATDANRQLIDDYLIAKWGIS